MVHNGIEYGLLQAYARATRSCSSKNFNSSWPDREPGNHGSVVRSWLNELAGGRSPVTTSCRHPRYVEDSARDVGPWKSDAPGRGRPPVITLSLLARSARAAGVLRSKVIAALRHEFGGHAVKSK